MPGTPEQLFQVLKRADLKKPAIAGPNKNLDRLVGDIFEQAREHRTKLIRFYVWYTSILSSLVMMLIFFQAAVRLFVYSKDSIELIPEWALNLIVIGMFGQFIGLLTIVTTKVWEFKPFLDHAKKITKNPISK